MVEIGKSYASGRSSLWFLVLVDLVVDLVVVMLVVVNLIRSTSLVLRHLFYRCPDLVVVAFCVRSGGGCLPVCCFGGGGGYLW